MSFQNRDELFEIALEVFSYTVQRYRRPYSKFIKAFKSKTGVDYETAKRYYDKVARYWAKIHFST